MYNTKCNILKNPLPCEAMHQDTQRTIFSVLPKIEMIKIFEHFKRHMFYSYCKHFPYYGDLKIFKN